MKPAFLKDDALLEDIRRHRAENPQDLQVWWMGQSGFLVTWQAHSVLFDPYLSDSLTRKYAGTDKPHVRMTEQVVDPSTLSGVDVVTTSHNHTDHLDRETLLALQQANPDMHLLGPEANREFISERLGTDPRWLTGLCDGQSVTLGGLTFHGIPSAHDERKRNDQGQDLFMGFILKMGPWTLYHSGDTRLYPGLEERLRAFSIDLAFLPINGAKPERRVAGNLNAAEAAQLAVDAKIGHVIPHHYDMFEFNTADPEDFIREASLRNVKHTVLRPGQRARLSH